MAKACTLFVQLRGRKEGCRRNSRSKKRLLVSQKNGSPRCKGMKSWYYFDKYNTILLMSVMSTIDKTDNHNTRQNTFVNYWQTFIGIKKPLFTVALLNWPQIRLFKARSRCGQWLVPLWCNNGKDEKQCHADVKNNISAVNPFRFMVW